MFPVFGTKLCSDLNSDVSPCTKFIEPGPAPLPLNLRFSFKISSGTDRWNRLGHALTDIIGLEFLSVFFGFMASFAESIGALFIVLGFLTRPCSFLLLFTMVVASFKHINDGDFSELAFIYALISLVIMINGDGKYSIDKYLFNRIN